ncbi:MAG: S41 family peptidase [Fibrobacter sp.]|nr:S41 family peptidase [Fibrobacter sp.]
MKVNQERIPAKTDVKKTPSVFCFWVILLSAVWLAGCSDFLSPVDSTPSPTEYSYNYWLLEKTFLFEEELKELNLPAEGDSVSDLYKAVKPIDPYTRYYPPSKSEDVSIAINTSVVQGDVGMEYVLGSTDYPLFIYRVYPDGPAGRAGVPRYGNIIQVNGLDIMGESAYSTYDSILTYSKTMSMTVVSLAQDTLRFELTKEDVYAPTLFVDTTAEGVIVMNIREFKLNTADKVNGSHGELKAYLDSTANETAPRIIDLRNNPGGHVQQCIAMADLFVKQGPLSTRSWRTFDAYGNSQHKKATVSASSGDPGEKGKFILLVNRNSASCAEIFAAAVSEGAGVPVVGENSFGKGIGQTTWKTYAKGLAIITNLEFLTPKGNSYHKNGIQPDYPCENVSLQCGVEAIKKYYGQSKAAKKTQSEQGPLFETDFPIVRNHQFIGGALLDEAYVR